MRDKTRQDKTRQDTRQETRQVTRARSQELGGSSGSAGLQVYRSTGVSLNLNDNFFTSVYTRLGPDPLLSLGPPPRHAACGMVDGGGSGSSLGVFK